MFGYALELDLTHYRIRCQSKQLATSKHIIFIHQKYVWLKYVKSHVGAQDKIKKDRIRELNKDKIGYRHDKLLFYHVFGVH